MLRRLPLVIRQLRSRHGDRPPFRVEDEFDLEDLLRALAACRCTSTTYAPRAATPSYAAARTRTDFLVVSPDGEIVTAVTVKRATPHSARERPLAEQLHEDTAYYERQPECRTLVAFMYDPEGAAAASRGSSKQPGPRPRARSMCGV